LTEVIITRFAELPELTIKQWLELNFLPNSISNFLTSSPAAIQEHANNLITKNHLRDWVIQVDTTLQNYKPYKTKKYENKQTETY
jgi:hypothetical protein